MSTLSVAVWGLACLLAAFTLLWLVSLRLRDASIADPFWGPAFLLAAVVYAGAAGGTAAGMARLQLPSMAPIGGRDPLGRG